MDAMHSALETILEEGTEAKTLVVLLIAVVVGAGGGLASLYYNGDVQLERHAQEVAGLFQPTWMGTDGSPIPQYSSIRKQVVFYNREARLFEIVKLSGSLPDGSWEALYEGRESEDVDFRYQGQRYKFRFSARESLGAFDYMLYGATPHGLLLAFGVGLGGFVTVLLVWWGRTEGREEGYEVPIHGMETEAIIRDQVPEGETLDYKSVFHWNRHIDRRFYEDKQHLVLKNIASFINTSGGTVLIGVSDDIEPLTVEKDVFENAGEARWHMGNAMRRMDPNPMDAGFIRDIRYDEVDGHKVLRVDCLPGDQPVFLTDQRNHRHPPREMFFMRRVESSEELQGQEMISYIKRRFGGWGAIVG